MKPLGPANGMAQPSTDDLRIDLHADRLRAEIVAFDRDDATLRFGTGGVRPPTTLEAVRATLERIALEAQVLVQRIDAHQREVSRTKGTTP